MEKVFPWDNNNLGGTEVALKWFHKNVLPQVKNITDYRCISVPGAPQNLEELFDGQRNIVWLHLTPDQIDDKGMNVLKRQDFLNTVDHFITLSEFHKKQTVLQLNVDPDVVHVIEYPLYGTEYNDSKFDNADRAKIIHASQAVRGLEVLLQATLQIDEDFQLDIYNDFYPEQYPENEALQKLLEDERITFYGKTPRNTVMKAFADSHIHAYPSIFEETSCLVQAEALSSGNLCVYSNIGALPETSRGYGMMVDFTSKRSMEDVVRDYADNLKNAINIVKNKKFDPQEQIEDISSYRSQERIIGQWLNFDKSLGG
jgi:glycosyltransferase involved in cell wall biosynthesis